MDRQVSSYEAKTKLAALLRRVEKGETIAITRHGVEVARLGPSLKAELERRRKAVEGLRRLRARTIARGGGMSSDEIVAAVHEGREGTASARYLRKIWGDDKKPSPRAGTRRSRVPKKRS